MLSALVKLNDLEHKFIRQQSQLEDKSEQIQEVQNRLEIQEKKHAERFKNLEEQYKNDIDKIKAEHAEDMRNMAPLNQKVIKNIKCELVQANHVMFAYFFVAGTSVTQRKQK